MILKTPSWRSSTQHHVLHYTAMIDVQTGLFTVAVFQDVAWAQKGLDALKQAGFPSESLTILAKESPEVGKLIEKTLGPTASVVAVTGFDDPL